MLLEVSFELLKIKIPLLASFEIDEGEFPLFDVFGVFFNGMTVLLGRYTLSDVLSINHILCIELNYKA